MMPWHRFGPLMVIFICLGLLSLNSCATPETSREAVAPPSPQAPEVQPARLSNQPIRQLHIQELVIPQADFDRYPTLAASHVGAGLSQLLVRVLTEMKRFDLILPPEELAQHLAQTWGPGPEGLRMRAARHQTQTPAAFRLSLKLFDIATCQTVSHLAVSQQQPSCRSHVGVQVRLEAPSGQFVPGATHPLAPQARHLHAESLPIWGTSEVAFSQSAVGIAAAKSIQYALLQALERLDRQGW